MKTLPNFTTSDGYTLRYEGGAWTDGDLSFDMRFAVGISRMVR